ncbi:hypothetical protein I5375_13055 [Citrobacter freundii]|uniref:hypothetical protein n=1 Tax=Citrobacter portucalensis TaxID=1639133 RepID=UPI0019014BD1|nr:hypothetical protein [Citrobacter freundii]MBJ8872688.1 hypothetical protein [Citrobacter braakii]MBJ8904285.1 hypothetical protein [Citrobacter braakii]MBJ8907526.1 hypothetical protein [Citrobacter braakii]MBJ8922913.1 hypothetical protein [Citrobacter braakii]
MKKIETSKELEAYIHDVTGIRPCIRPIENYGMSFILNGSIKKNRTQLQNKISNHHWDGDRYGCLYRDEEMNLMLLLNKAGGETLCIATILSLHSKYLEQFDY